MNQRNHTGFTLIELLIVLTIVGILATLVLFTTQNQLMKARDGKRKADLAKIQKVLEDYINDQTSYPTRTEYGDCGSTEGTIFEGYTKEIPCDPTNNDEYNYFYSPGTSDGSWYKIYAKLENDNDPIIAKVDCASGCGPGNNYNFWVSSANMNKVEKQPDEDWGP